jgi:hypothetical protein
MGIAQDIAHDFLPGYLREDCANAINEAIKDGQKDLLEALIDCQKYMANAFQGSDSLLVETIDMKARSAISKAMEESK